MSRAMDRSTLSESLHPLEIQVLAAFSPSDHVLSDQHLHERCQLDSSQLSMAVGWLVAKQLLEIKSETVTFWVSLTDRGKEYLTRGSPPRWILHMAEEAEQAGRHLTIPVLLDAGQFEPTEISRAIGALKKEGAIRLGAGGVIERTGQPSPTAEALETLLERVRDQAQDLLTLPSVLQAVARQYAVKRGNPQEPFRIEERIHREYRLTPLGRSVAVACQPGVGEEEISQLTPELLKDGAWRTKRFRKYTIQLRPPRTAVGRRHPYREFLDQVKFKLISMGFQEMRGPLVETEFWDMDALFMPQFHPARAIHDVYFVKYPSHAGHIPEPFLSQVAAAHEHGGGTGSTGWRYTYDRERARRLILRSQGTAVSARTLAHHPAIPGKYFSIARCFRYDQVDATHATDFFQVEGIVLGEDITFRTLLGLLTLFAREMAHAQESRFLPAYFPFTEPSVELHVRHPQLGWMELGGAGLFRPEVTHPLGVTVPVIAWGLGLDRMAMIALGLHDIRDLFTADLEKIRSMRRRLF
ncbi:MAG: phenylalanine--tRNA ligase subunit alpha [Nitrospirae bacterium]|nr:MAG: phenylalanine--tRNA ligase subunit alpha [Nitrospirota bacterium]